MTRHKILTDLYNSKDVNDCIGKMEPAHLRQDLKQELFIILFDEKYDIEGMYQRGELRFFCARIITNMICSNTSPFYKTYRQDILPLNENIERIQSTY